MKIGIFDILLLGLAVYVIVRLMTSNKRSENDDSERDIDVTPRKDERGLDPHDMAARYWDYLRGEEKTETGTASQQARSQGEANGLDADEFIKGAKAVYTRLFDSYLSNDTNDMGQFATRQGLDKLRARLDFVSQSGKPSILLLNAELKHSVRQGDITRAEVEYRVLFGRQNADNLEITDTLSFVRDESQPGSTWLLDDLNPAGSARIQQA